jgi:N utilization substance protein B
MGKRRKAREVVLNALYFREMSGDCLEKLTNRIQENQEVKEEVRDYATRLLRETVKNLESIDKHLSDIIKNWDFQRVAMIDKCILRFASAEILYFPDIPVKVSIDEAVEIAKAYSTEHSGRFVNGILDEIAHRAKLI